MNGHTGETAGIAWIPDGAFITGNVHILKNSTDSSKKKKKILDSFIWCARKIYPCTAYYKRSSWENRLFAYAKTKTQISFAVAAKLISAFVFATRIVQSLYFLYTKLQACSHLGWLYSLVCVGPGRKPRRPFFLRTRLIQYFCN